MDNKQTQTASGKGKMAVVLVRGLINTDGRIKSSIHMLNLHRKNNCVVVSNTPEFVGMIKKSKDYVTYGEIDEETLKLLIQKRGEEGRKTFYLSPPRKGFGRKGIKKSFSIGGGLGYRGIKINDLIKRMI